MMVIIFIVSLIDLTLTNQSFGQEELGPYNRDHYVSSFQERSDDSALGDHHYTAAPEDKVQTVTVVDYAEPTNPYSNLTKVPFSTFAIDPCGDGSNQYTLESEGVRWRDFPITYAINTDDSGVAPSAARNAVINAFGEFDKYMPGASFVLINDYEAAKIKFKWEPIDGPFNRAGFASYSYTLPARTITAATITLDSDENWFVSPLHRCTSTGSSLDIQNVASHEIGHGVGLGHVPDNLLTMYQTSFAGETLKRSLGLGDISGLEFLYGEWSSWTGLNGNTRANSDIYISSDSQGRLFAFMVSGITNTLYYKHETSPGSGTWTPSWIGLGGTVRENSDIVVTKDASDRLSVFIVSGINNAVYYKLKTAP